MRVVLPGLFLLLLPVAAHPARRPPDIEKLAKKCREGKWFEGCVKLMDLARTDPDDAVRSAAIRALTDQNALTSIVTLAGPLHLRLEALARIDDPARLVEVALRTFGEDGLALRLGAVARIATPPDLVRLAKEAEVDTAAAAVRRLEDEALALDVYTTVVGRAGSRGDETPVLEAAVEKITSQQVLSEIASAGHRHDGRAALRTLALGRIHDAAIRLRLARSATPIAEEAVRSLRDQESLSEAALHAVDFGARAEAIKRLGDQAVLARLAKGHPLSPRSEPRAGQTPVLTWEQASAIEGLTDRALLTELARSRDVAIARAATERLAAVKATPLVDVAGELFEPRLGKPLAQYRVEAFNASGRLIATATTDGAGRFQLRGVNPGKWTLVHWPDKAVVEVGKAGGDLGRVPFNDEALVTQAFGEVCRSPGPTQHAPAVPLLVLSARQRHASAAWRPEPNPFAWDRPWKAILCLTKTNALVGRYVDKRGLQTGQAYRADWDARLVRLHDGRVFAASFSADPPEETQIGMGVGSPSAQVAAWLQTIE